MFQDLVTMFYNHVMEAYNAYAAEKRRGVSGRDQHLRNALELASVLFHFREHFPSTIQKTRTQVEKECAEYRLIADVVNAAKHSEVTKPTPQGTSLVAKASDIQEVTVNTIYEDEEGEYTNSENVIRVNCTDGIQRNLDQALIRVLNYWGHVLEKLSGKTYRALEIPAEPGSRFVSRSEVGPCDLEAMQGVGWLKHFQLRRFDSDKGISEPVDLTGAELKFSIFKPSPVVLAVTANLPDGREIEIEFELTDEQSAAYRLLKSDADRQRFGESIIEERREEIQDKLSAALTEKIADGVDNPDEDSGLGQSDAPLSTK